MTIYVLEQFELEGPSELYFYMTEDGAVEAAAEYGHSWLTLHRDKYNDLVGPDNKHDGAFYIRIWAAEVNP